MLLSGVGVSVSGYANVRGSCLVFRGWVRRCPKCQLVEEIVVLVGFVQMGDDGMSKLLIMVPMPLPVDGGASEGHCGSFGGAAGCVCDERVVGLTYFSVHSQRCAGRSLCVAVLRSFGLVSSLVRFVSFLNLCLAGSCAA